MRILRRNKNRNKTTDKRISELLDIIKAKDDRINKLEDQFNELEQTMNKKNIIITGLNLHSYAATTATPKQNVRSSPTTDDEPQSITDSLAMSTNFVNFARQKLNVHLEPYDISAIHNLPPRRAGERPVIVQLHSAWKKQN